MQPTPCRPPVSLAPKPAPWLRDASFRTLAPTLEQRGFALVDHTLSLYGQCRTCADAHAGLTSASS